MSVLELLRALQSRFSAGRGSANDRFKLARLSNSLRVGTPAVPVEHERVQLEAQCAQLEAQRATISEQRAGELVQRLRELGIDPDSR